MQFKFYSSISCVPVAWFHYGTIHLFLWAPWEAHMNKHESIFLPNAKGHDGASSSLTDHLPLINRTQNGLQPSILCPMSCSWYSLRGVQCLCKDNERFKKGHQCLEQSCKCNWKKLLWLNMQICAESIKIQHSLFMHYSHLCEGYFKILARSLYWVYKMVATAIW